MTAPPPAAVFPEIPLDPSPGQYQRIAREIAAAQKDDLDAVRVGILASSTLDFLRPPLVVEGARNGLAVDLFLGDFGQLEQPVLAEGSELYAFDPDILVLAFQPYDIAPDSIERFYRADGADLDQVCAELTDRLIGTATAFQDKTGRPVLIANFATPAILPLGPFDAGDPNGLTHRIARHNLALAESAGPRADIYVWDYAGLVREEGSLRWSDPRLRLLARTSVAGKNQPATARHLLRMVESLRRRPAKCLVLDLDNTLWGGVVGDDGLQGIQIGDDWPGSPFKAFQRSVLGLRDRGVLLAVVSKNDEAVAAEVFHRHPEMLIGWDDLAAVRINWNPKSGNMRAIADELNIGIDSLVLFDDNPVERAEVRSAVPEAGVVEVPTDPTRYTAALMASGFFDQPGLSTEDRGRADMYRVDRARRTLRDEAPSLDDFLASLEMEAEVGPADGETLGRIAQLIGKTNQFNLTTRRHAPADIANLAEADGYDVVWLRVRDRFGDQGLISVAIVEKRDEVGVLDTFLMSCRVMNRGVEKAMMAYLAERSAAMGCTHLVGEYRPTAKNHMVEHFFADFGFTPDGQSDGGVLWKLALSGAPLTWPEHISRVDRTRNPEQRENVE